MKMQLADRAKLRLFRRDAILSSATAASAARNSVAQSLRCGNPVESGYQRRVCVRYHFDIHLREIDIE